MTEASATDTPSAPLPRTGSVSYGTGYSEDYESCASGYLMPTVMEILATLPPARSIFEIGCGTGADAAYLARHGHQLVGIDPAQSGVAIAKERYPDLTFEVASTNQDLAAQFGTFDVVLSLEVVEHVYAPQRFAAVTRSLLKPGGIAIVSTPYHGYLKNLALAVTGKFDAHFTALWEGGHIKFWSKDTLDKLFLAAGMVPCAYQRVGRVPALAKSMIVAYRHAGADGQ